MTDPQVALFMLGIFIIVIFLGFPIAFTLMAMGISFGYYAYFDSHRMWRAYERAVENGADSWTQFELWVDGRSEEHTSELQSLMRLSYAVFCLKTKHSIQT